MLEIDGSRYSGSGTLVRQAVALAALTRKPVRITNARARRPNPGLRPQHVRVIEAICQLAAGEASGVREGSQEVAFVPGQAIPGQSYAWDIGSAGSTTMLALAVLPVLAFAPGPAEVELRGGLFQDFAPSYYHLRHVMAPLLARMGLGVQVDMERPGYVPRGGGILRLRVQPAAGALLPVVLDQPARVGKLWGIALASHLKERQVGQRMAEAASEALARAGHRAAIEVCDDATSLQPGAALALFADLDSGARLGADMSGAPGRRAESIGRRVAQQLLEDLGTGATLDRYAADQVIPFAALAAGTSRFRIPRLTDHIQSNAWLVQQFLGADVSVEAGVMEVRGVAYRPAPA